MLAISVWQPWASLWACGAKLHETRHWPVPATACGRRILGTVIAVHAARKLIRRGALEPRCAEICRIRFGEDWEATLPRGAIVGTGRLIACWQTVSAIAASIDDDERALGDWSPRRYAWQLAGAALLARPVACKGRQGWFEVDPWPRSSS